VAFAFAQWALALRWHPYKSIRALATRSIDRLATMSRIALFALFITVATAVLGGWHYYMWRRFVRDTRLSGWRKKAATIATVLLAAALPMTMMLSRTIPSDAMRPIAIVGFTWLGTAFLMFMMLVASDVVRLAGWLSRKATRNQAPTDPRRRQTLARIVAGAALATGAAGTAWGMGSALGRIPIERVRIALRRFPASMNGMRLVQLTDMHVGPTLRRAYVERVVNQVNALNPDLIAITGDLVDGTVEQLRKEVAPLAGLRARHGVFFVTGNHEYFSGANAWIEELTRMGIRVLRNERVRIGDETASFDLAGVDDWSSSGLGEGHGHDPEAAMRGWDGAREVVMLAHQPRSIWDAARLGVGLQLSGHTHGGQIFPWMMFVLLQQPFVVGLHRVRDTWLYVSRGTGFWGPPMRVGAPPEITLVELEREQGSEVGAPAIAEG
jgi:predicted MPP superfamily phosphohydrolase